MYVCIQRREKRKRKFNKQWKRMSGFKEKVERYLQWEELGGTEIGFVQRTKGHWEQRMERCRNGRVRGRGNKYESNVQCCRLKF